MDKKNAELLQAIRELLMAVERAEDNDFSAESRRELAKAADSAATAYVYELKNPPQLKRYCSDR